RSCRSACPPQLKKSDVLPLGKIPCGRGYFDFFDRVKYLSLPSNGKIARMEDSNTPLAITSSSSKSS
ncbi:hypothetical protein, partial [Microbispora sp. NPDC046933]|uniref:hypothetical protein n=1 Tax=Microbispora sp. NPDC046933 TaxID=3155618 RepID=UPI0033D8FD20